MAIRIQKGGSTEIRLEKFSVGLGWQVREDASAKDDFDLDVSAFMVDASSKIPADDYLVFYNSEKGSEQMRTANCFLQSRLFLIQNGGAMMK